MTPHAVPVAVTVPPVEDVPQLESFDRTEPSVLQRHCDARSSADWLDQLAGDPRTRYLAIWPAAGALTVPITAPAAFQDRAPELALSQEPPFADGAPEGTTLLRVYLGQVPLRQAPQHGDTADESHEDAGQDAGTHVIAVVPTHSVYPSFDGAQSGPQDGAGAVWMGFREIAAELGPVDQELLLTATAIINWHRNHTHCPRCGTPTEVTHSGWVRRCPADQTEHFPRTDPAVIVAVTDDQDRLLLGANAAWGGQRYSTLAGFVEPGETLEAAVVREIREEAGIRVTGVRYMKSQSWPFPASLMLAFRARTEDTELIPDGEEIVDLRWFTRDALGEAVASSEIQVPPRASVARALVESWYGGPLPEPGQNQTERN